MRSPLLLPLLGLLLCALPVHAQDLHNSQFYLNPLHLNPGATGVFDGEWRVSGLYRSQWRSVPVGYRTYAAAADWKALQRGKSLFSAGLLLQNDEAGDAQLAWSQGGISVAAAHALSKTSMLSLGFGFSGLQRKADIGNLRFKNQWTNDGFDPLAPSREPFGASSGLSASLSAGLVWHYQDNETRHRLTAGLGAFHLNRPVVSLGGADRAKTPLRTALFAQGAYELREQADLIGFMLVQTAKSAKEIVIGAGMRQILTTGLANHSAAQLTFAARWGDALIPALQFERNNWTLGLSYDWNISRFDEATDGRGGIEIAVIWRVVPVPVTKTVKCCPVF
ncbi:MAG: PorP/SprF family type IX secretion system membrane protein [Saprospiraceae bacterium]|nr:PorP/SprF family type IX secretion system membrane protein [Saprospiraceae bacterium]